MSASSYSGPDRKGLGSAWAPACLALLSLAGVGLILYSTTRGPGVGGDATIYLSSAQNLLAGKGLGLIQPDGSFRPLPYSPPFFPLVLSALGLLRIDLLQAARWLNALLFGGTIFVAGLACARFTRSWGLALVSAMLLIVSPVLARVYAWAMSEPLFLMLGFLGLFLAVEYTLKPSAKLLWGAAMACGLSFLARYVGVSFVGAAGLLILSIGSTPFGHRLKDAVIFGVISLAPMAVWLVIDFLETQTVASRSLASGLTLGAQVRAALPALKSVGLSWLVPSSWVDTPPYPQALNNFMLVLAVIALLALAGLVTWRITAARRAHSESPAPASLRYAAALGLLIGVDIVVTLVVYLTTYPPITLDNRMFAPLHVAVLLLIVSLAGLLMAAEPARRWLKIALWAILLAFLASYAVRGPRIFQQTHTDGLGYMVDAWQQSPTITAVRALPAGTIVVTNEETAVQFLSGRIPYALAEVYATRPKANFDTYGSDTSDDAQRAFRERGAALVLFSSISDQMQAIYGAQAQQRLDALTKGLVKAYSGTDGSIYYYGK